MVMVKLAGAIADIQGKVGGDVWRLDQCGVHIQKQPRVIFGPPSPKQLAQRRAWRKCANFWMTYITSAAQDLWWIWSYAHPFVNKKGEETFMPPYQSFMSVNVKRVIAGMPITLIPPPY